MVLLNTLEAGLGLNAGVRKDRWRIGRLMWGNLTIRLLYETYNLCTVQ